MTQQIDGDGGTLSFEAVTLTFPPGAVPFPVPITVSSEADCPLDESGLDALTPLYEFSPEGLSFAAPVKVRLAPGAPPSDGLPVVRWTSPTLGWETAGLGNSDGGVEGTISHFSGGYAAWVKPTFTFQAFPETIVKGEESELHLIIHLGTAVKVESCYVQSVGPMIQSIGYNGETFFSLNVKPPASTIYDINCTGDANMSGSILVNVVDLQASLSASPEVIQAGQSTTLSFHVASGIDARLEATPPPRLLLANVGSTTTLVDSPTVNTTYRLVVFANQVRQNYAITYSANVTVQACETPPSDLCDGLCTVEIGTTTSIGTAATCTAGATVTGCSLTGFPDGFSSGLTSSGHRPVRGRHQPAATVPSVTLTVDSHVAPGTYAGNIIVYASDGNSQTLPLSIVVGNPSIALSTSPASLSVSPGGTAQTQVTSTRMFGASCDTTVHVTGLPAGVTAADIVIPAANAFGYPYSTGPLTIAASGSAASTASPVTATLNATCGTYTASASLAVTVQPPPAGSLDGSFGTAGIVTSLIGGATAEQINDVAIDSNGNILVVGSITLSGTQKAFVARYSSSGGLDASFNAGGSNGGNGFATWSWSSGRDVANHLILGPGTAITVVGTVNFNTDIGVARLTNAGVLDMNFGVGGTARVAFSGNALNFGTSGYIDAADGSLVVAGEHNDLTVARFTPAGALDTTFGKSNGGSGKLGYQTIPATTYGSIAWGVAPSGSDIIAAGTTGHLPNNGNVIVAEFDSTGLPVTGFGSSGVASLTPTLLNDYLSAGFALLVQGNGLIVAGQQSPNSGDNTFLLVRTDLAGALDSSFGSSGVVAPIFPPSGQFTAAQAHALKVDSMGRLVSAGYAYAGHSRQNVGVARLSSSGVPDATFLGPSGSAAGLFSFAASTDSDQANGIAFQSDGKIILAGTSTGSSSAGFIARLLP